ncbi:UNVERIFIED_CONTAM: hypothetical protein K2H54_047722 [Gekko kuhli]
MVYELSGTAALLVQGDVDGKEQFSRRGINEGLGQLEAYTEEKEGVALQMDNGMFWNSVEDNHQFPIQGSEHKYYSSKFFVTVTHVGKVALRDYKGLYLTPRPVGLQPFFPLNPMHTRPLPSSEFIVFHKDNRVAFKTNNGLFLAQVFRGAYVVEACKTSLDDSCFFKPQIGDPLGPDYTILNVAVGDISKLRCRLCILKKETFVNRGEEPVRHPFMLTWKEGGIQTTAWTHRWGLGQVTTGEFTILDTKATLKYNKDNDQVVSVPKIVYESLTDVVELPPKTKATARLVVYKQDHATVSFQARIRKLRPGGTVDSFVEPGVWRGLVYHSLRLEIEVEPLGILCATM